MGLVIKSSRQFEDPFTKLATQMRQKRVARVLIALSIVGVAAFTALNAVGVGVPLDQWYFKAINGTALGISGLCTLGIVRGLWQTKKLLPPIQLKWSWDEHTHLIQ